VILTANSVKAPARVIVTANSVIAPARSGRGTRCAPQAPPCGACVARLPGAGGPFQSHPCRLVRQSVRAEL